MSIAAIAPKGGIIAELGDESRPLVLRNMEIERFETQHAPMGIFALLDQLLGRADPPQARHIRDIVALGLVGGGLPDRAADDIIGGLPPTQNFALRQIAQELVMMAFVPEEPQKKSGEAGLQDVMHEASTDGTSPQESGVQLPPDSAPTKSDE